MEPVLGDQAGRKLGPPMEFANLLWDSVKEGIGNTLGRAVADTLFTLIKPSQVYADRPGEFHHDLAQVFGSASISLEKMISKELFHRLNLRYPVGSDIDFETCVKLARQEAAISKRNPEV